MFETFLYTPKTNVFKWKKSDSNHFLGFIYFYVYLLIIQTTDAVKPVLSGHSKIDKTMVLKTNGSLMKVESIAERSQGAFCSTFDLH